MKRTLAFAFVVSAAIVLSGAPAFADDQYTPIQPTGPSIAGSTAVGECQGDVPWISYSVDLTDPDNQVTDKTATLVITDGSNTAELELGQLENNHLEGRVMWPGASTDGQGSPTGWPGWEMVNGSWVQTAGNYAWTRGDITAEIVVNPAVTVALSYPEATPDCAVAPPGMASTTSLPATGLDAPVLPIALVGGGLLIFGAGFLATRRLRQR